MNLLFIIILFMISACNGLWNSAAKISSRNAITQAPSQFSYVITTFDRFMSRVEQNDFLNILKMNGLISKKINHELIPTDLRAWGILGWLDWAPTYGHQLPSELSAWKAYQLLKQRFEKNPSDFLSSLAESSLEKIYSDRPQSPEKSAEDKFHIYFSTRHRNLASGLTSLIPAEAGTWDDGPDRIANSVNQMPVGAKVMRGNFRFTFIPMPPDAQREEAIGAFNGDWEFPFEFYPTTHPGFLDRKSRYRGVWMDRWTSEMQRLNGPYLDELKRLVPDLNGVVWDLEEDNSWWELIRQTTPDGVPALEHLQNDRRYGELVNRLGFPIELGWRAKSEKSQKFDETTYQMMRESLQVVADMFLERWPDTMRVLSDYESHRKSIFQPHSIKPGKNVGSEYGIGTLVGGYASSPHYGGVGEIWDPRTQSMETPKHPDTPWNTFVHSVAIARSHQFASTAPYIAFITNKGFLRGLEKSDLYQELILHLAMASDRFPALWGWFRDEGSIGGITRTEFELLNDLLKEATTVFGRKNRRTIPPEEVLSYSNEWVISGIDVGGKRVLRVTPMTPATVTTESNKVTIRQSNGATKVFEGMKPLPKYKSSPIGIWLSS